MPVQVKVSGDPRRPNEVHKYKRRKVEDNPPDVFLLIALALGMIATLMKMKIFGWASLLCCIVAVANAKAGTGGDFKQFFSSIIFAMFGLVSAYLQQIPNRAARST